MNIPEPSLEKKKEWIFQMASESQQYLYEFSNDWNEYTDTGEIYLKNYIGYALFGPPRENNDSYVYKEPKNAMQIIQKIYDKIFLHGKQLSDNTVLCSIIHCCMYDEDSLSKCKDKEKLSSCMYILPIFKVLKNIQVNKQVKFEDWYIDTQARVYSSWDDFKKNNMLPECTIVAPKNGTYQANLREIWSETESCVWLEEIKNSHNSIIKMIDTASSAGSILGIGTLAVTLFTPLGVGTVGAAAVAGLLGSSWTGLKSVTNLIDRSSHEQNLASVDAIPLWVGAIGSATGLAAASSTALVKNAVRTGVTINKGTKIAYNLIMIGNLSVNGIGAMNNIYSVYKNYSEDKEVSTKDLLLVTTHLFFLTNSIVNLKFASTIIKDGQTAYLKEYETSLRSNRHKKEFQKLLRNSKSLATDKIKRNELIIRSLNKIDNKDEFFEAMFQNRKLFTSTNTMLNFVDGQLESNKGLLISPSEFFHKSKDSIINMLIYNNAPLKVKNIWEELENVPRNENIFSYIIKCGSIITIAIWGKPIKELFLNIVTNYVWEFIKYNLVQINVKINNVIKTSEKIVLEYVKKTYNHIVANLYEWVKLIKKRLGYSDTEENLEKSEVKADLVNELTKDNKSNIIELLNPSEYMSQPNDLLKNLVSEALESTKSNLNKPCKLETNVEKIYKREIDEFFNNYKLSLKFEIRLLSEKLKNILMDLKYYDKKGIIIYKLLRINFIIIEKMFGQYDDLEETTFINLFEFVWLNVLLNFAQLKARVEITDNECQNYILDIIMAIYNTIVIEKNCDTWISAFNSYSNNDILKQIMKFAKK